jgi:tetratricopeptide (TPR) repeat protein
VFSLSVELAEGEEEEEEEEDDIPYLEPIGRGTAGSGRSGKPAVEEPLPPPRKVRERVAEHVLEKMFEEAHEHLVAGDLQMAVQQLSDIIDLEENFLLAYVARGRIFLDLGDYARAMSDFTIAHETGPDEAEPQLAIGDLYFSRKDYDRAIQFFNGALSVVPDNAMALCRRGISHYYERNFERAQNDLGRALELDGHIPNASTYLSMAKKKSSR